MSANNQIGFRKESKKENSISPSRTNYEPNVRGDSPEYNSLSQSKSHQDSQDKSAEGKEQTEQKP